jgi:hypothetical protein
VIEKNVRKTFENLKTEPPSCQEVRIALQKLKNNKSSGSDILAPELFKYSGDSLVMAFNELLKIIWTKCMIPTEWKTAIVVPIHKKGDTT